MPGTRVAAILVCWNSGAVLERCLAALAAQTRAFDRVIVVDNGSADFPANLPWRGTGDLTLMRCENPGFAAANNRAIECCDDCDWLALVNPDAFLAPDWLAQMLDAAETFPAAASFASRLICDEDQSRLDGAGDAMHVSGMPWRIAHGDPSGKARLVPAEVFSACAAAALYRRPAVVEAGGFDERFFCYVEDVDLGFRLRLAGHVCRYVPTAVARHVGGVSSGGLRSEFAVFHGHRNLVWCFIKNMPAPLWLISLPLHCLATVLVFMVSVWRRQGVLVCRAKLAALQRLPEIWRERRHVQAARRASALQVLCALSWWRSMRRGT